MVSVKGMELAMGDGRWTSGGDGSGVLARTCKAEPRAEAESESDARQGVPIDRVPHAAYGVGLTVCRSQDGKGMGMNSTLHAEPHGCAVHAGHAGRHPCQSTFW